MHPVKVTDANFRQEVLGHPGTVLVDFWASWCGACSMVTPVLDQLAEEFSGRVKIAKLNVDENPVTSSHYGIRSIPSLLFFKNGTRVNTITGALPKDELKRHIQSML
jgi:thioredoxin